MSERRVRKRGGGEQPRGAEGANLWLAATHGQPASAACSQRHSTQQHISLQHSPESMESHLQRVSSSR